MNRFPMLARLEPFLAIHSPDPEIRRTGRMLQWMTGIIILGLVVRGVLDVVQGAVSTAAIQLGLAFLLGGMAYVGTRSGRVYLITHLFFLTLFIIEIIALWPTMDTALQYAPLILPYLVAVIGVLPFRHSFPYAIFGLAAALRLQALGLPASQYIITGLSLVLVVWVITRVQKNALRQAQEASRELAELNSHLQERVAEQTVSLRHSNDKLQVSLAVGRAASASLNLDEQLYNTARLIRAEFGFDHVTIFLADENNRELVLREATGEVGQRQKQEGLRVRIGDVSIVGWVAEQREARVAHNTANDPFFRTHPLLPQTQSELALPLLTRNFLVGVLDVQSSHAEAFSPEDITILQLMADQLANNIENAMLFHEVEQRTAHLAKLQTITALMSQQASTQNALNVLSQQTIELAGADGSAVFLWRPQNQHLELEINLGIESLGAPGFSVKSSEGLTGRCFTENKTLVLEDYAAWPARILATENTPIHAILAVPIRERGTPIGVLLVVRQQGQEPFNADEVQVIELLASQAGTIITNQQLIEETQQSAYRERALNQASADIRRNLDAEMVLESAAQHVAHLLGNAQVTVRLYPAPPPTEP